MRPTLKLLLIPSLLLALSPQGLMAQATAPALPPAELKTALALSGDAAHGKALFNDCAVCHRKDASGRSAGALGPIPRLAGQHAGVILKQVLDIRSGQRSNPTMKPFLDDASLSLQSFADIASYLQSLPVTSAPGKDAAATAARGKPIYDRDCAVCHGANGEGRAEQYVPMVAGQHNSYLLRELGQIKAGERGNSNAEMAKLLIRYELADLQALADFMARLPIPAK